MENEYEYISSYRISLRKGEDFGNERGSSRSHCMDKSLREILWTCRKIGYGKKGQFLVLHQLQPQLTEWILAYLLHGAESFLRS